ncbi:CheY chemotaxis protein or a CheY-like REC (receiver) domain [Malonomonas rubra DSM 5091]|uniref:CheY chemotaxis protein or a CheY-like REC (Receiver) domain n=1 Tax=Malonomonas rubra DSM 5091 TaxID=1122189 RepID=A0A1M6JW70_MALRU|nr:response regulator [Malonomonas rubra]SHJ50930.1 CheY chemotaxis protein or a CheY-like REC (receiver) domain [Malonomonas rubra DSM 5091]
MKARKILIVDKDPVARQQLADFFEESNYHVDTTASAAFVVAHIIKKNQPIILLGNSFEEKISPAEVVSLLRECNKELNIILISDENSPEMLRKVREKGIFYHSLKPHTREDNEELLSVVECAVGDLGTALT